MKREMPDVVHLIVGGHDVARGGRLNVDTHYRTVASAVE
jgi:hypothetical protein